ncbi:hypothetical protein [[Mycoplasma] imitans]|uniref:hypothetical protein n=1 Tax=[Mycoplasma] imitans TaxID=29560 RepID=UPI000684A3E9|nr:hypothetical protein [[Mycoplasma] imitans]
MKKAYAIINALTLLSTSFQGGVTNRATINEAVLVNHVNNSIVSLSTDSPSVNLTFVLNRDWSKNTVESVKNQIIKVADTHFNNYVQEVQGWVDEFKERFKDLYRIDSVEYVQQNIYWSVNQDVEFQQLLDNATLNKSVDERTNISRPNYGEITDFGTYSNHSSANYNFAGNYDPIYKDYVEFIHSYSHVIKKREIPRYDVFDLPLADKQLEYGFIKYKKDTSLHGIFDRIPNTNNQYYALTNVDIGSNKFTVREKKHTGWYPTLYELNNNREKRNNLTSVKYLRWKVHPVSAATYDKFNIVPNAEILVDSNNRVEFDKIKLYFWKSPSGKWRIINNRVLVNLMNNWFDTSSYRVIKANPTYFNKLYELKDSPKTLSINVDNRSELISAKYDIFADYFVLPDNFTYKTINFNITNRTAFNGYRNLINLFINNIKIESDSIQLRDNYVYSKIDTNLTFWFWYNDQFIKLIDHIRKIKKYTVNSNQNKYKNLSIDYADVVSLQRNNSIEFFNNLIQAKGRNYVSNFQRELFYFLGITTSEINDYQYDFIMALPELFDQFNQQTKLIGDIYIGSNKISDRVLIANNETPRIDINSEEIRNRTPQLDLNRNLLQLTVNNLRFYSEEIDSFNGKINTFQTIQNENSVFKLDEVSIRLNLNYRYDFLNIKYKNSIAELNDFNVRTFEPLYASDFNHKIGVDRSIEISDILIDAYKSIYLNSNSIYINQDGVYSPDQSVWTGNDLNIMPALSDRYNLNFDPNNVTGEFWSIIRVLNGNDFAIPGTEAEPELIPDKLYFFKNDENIKAKFYLVKFKAFNKVIDINKSRISFEHEIVPEIKLNYLDNNFGIRLLTDYENNLLSDQTINLKINQEYSISQDDANKLVRAIEPVLATRGLKILNNSIQVNERANQLNFTLYSLDKVEKTAFNPITNFDLSIEKENNNILKINGKFNNNLIFNLDYQINISDNKILIKLLNPDQLNLAPVLNSKDKITELIKNEINKYNFVIRSWDNFDIANPSNEIQLINTSTTSLDEDESDISREEIIRNNSNNQRSTNNEKESKNQQNEQINNKKATNISFDLKDKKNLIIFIVSVSLISLALIIGTSYGIVKLTKKNKRRIRR